MIIYFIANRDFKGLWRRPMMHLLMAVNAIFMSFFYLQSLVHYSTRSQTASGPFAPSIQMDLFAQHISLVHLWLILFLPVLTMKLIAEEKKNRSFELLSSSPISAWQITLGKFLAGVMSALIMVLVSFLYPLATAGLVTFNWAPLLLAYCGIFFVSVIYVSLGLLASAINESIMQSIMLGWFFCFAVFFLGKIGLSASDSSFWSGVFMQASMSDHLYSFMQGVLKLKSLIFMISVPAFFLFVTERILDSEMRR